MAGAAGLSSVVPAAMASTETAAGQKRPSAKPPKTNSKTMVGYADKPMDKVRVGVIGVGARGPSHIHSLLAIEGVEIKAICDLYKDWAENAQATVVKAGHPAPTLYTNGEHDFENMNARDDIDMVIIATPWHWHVPMAVDAMKKGKHAFTEVPAALTIEDCWKLVDTSEATRRHCMMMENVNYGREELMVLNMARLGVFGEMLHGEGSYIHDLRGQMNEVERGTGSWRTLEYMARNGNLYPTHGLGPIAQYMGVNRGDRFDYMSSVSSPSRMRNLYANEHFPKDHKWNSKPFVCGDLNTSILKTVKGRTIMVQWDEQLPRPYSRLNFLQGTKGTWGGFPDRITVEGVSKSTDSWSQGDDLKPWYDQYDHPLYRQQGSLAQSVGGHGGMDFLMMWRIIYCLHHGLPLDQDVYDAAAWSAVTPLSEWSVANRSQSADFPDFTRGHWQDREPLPVFDPSKA